MATNKLDGRVTKLEISAAEDKIVLKGIAETLKGLDVKIDAMDHVIRGNGAPGLAAKVDWLTSSRARWRDSLVGVVIGVSVGTVVFVIEQWWHFSRG